MEVKENKMGTMPVNKLLVNISLPMVISMLVQALYNIVDSIFVAQIDEYALTAGILGISGAEFYDRCSSRNRCSVSMPCCQSV